MREILFRGKRVDNGRWVEGQYTCEEYEPHLQKVLHIDRIAIAGACVSVGVIPDTVGQYTGLKDKNGKRIFEHDIVRIAVCGTYDNYVISYDKENARFVVGDTGFAFWSYISTKIEVIGNVHDGGAYD